MAQMSEYFDGFERAANGGDTLPAVASNSSRHAIYKRPMDILLGSILLTLLLPAFGLIALLVKMTSRGPVLFRQERLGLNATPFTLHKFRTMYVGADEHTHREYFQQYLRGASAPGESSNVYKLRSDPRITPVGGLLRRLGLDELPQMINVLRGEMSLVGPRPPLHYEVAHYTARHIARLAVKPGMTGLWQIQGRDVVDFESMIDMDLEYARRQSIWLDLKILFLTGPSVLWALFCN